MSLHERFAKLVEGLYEIKDEPAPVEQGGALLSYQNRIYHLGLLVERAQISVSTQVYASSYPDGADVFVDIVSDFNAYHLFHGGYRLNVAPQSFDLYVTQVVALERLEHLGLGAFLEIFAARCASCARWYDREIAKRPAPEFDLTKLDLTPLPEPDPTPLPELE